MTRQRDKYGMRQACMGGAARKHLARGHSSLRGSRVTSRSSRVAARREEIGDSDRAAGSQATTPYLRVKIKEEEAAQIQALVPAY